MPIQKWKERLAAKEDYGYFQWVDVLRDLVNLGPPKCCEALDILYKAHQNNPRYQIVMAILTKELSHRSCVCQGYPPPLEMLQKALRQSYEMDNNLLAAQVNFAIAHQYFAEGELGLSIVHYNIAKELMEEEGLHLFRNYAYLLYNLGDMLYRSRDYRGSANVLLQSIHYRGATEFNQQDSLDIYWRMNSWNNLGLCYKQIGLLDSAFYAFNQAYPLAHNDFWQGLINGNRGDVFFQQGRYDSAQALLQFDYQKSIEADELDNAAITMQMLSLISNSKGDHRKALQMLHEANALDHKRPNWDHRARIFHTYALIYRDLGMADSSFIYMSRHDSLSDYIEREVANDRVEIARMAVDNEEYVHEIQSLRKDRNRILLIRNFSIALILALAALGYLYVNRMRLKASMKQKEAMAAKQKAESEAAMAQEQLLFYTNTLREKTRLLEELETRTQKKEIAQQNVGLIEELTHQTILTDDDWERFKILFTKVYPGFFVSLKQQIPDITIGEQRMAALIMLRISIKEAAAMLGVSQNSIYKTRQRLRLRLGLNQDADLDDHFLNHG